VADSIISLADIDAGIYSQVATLRHDAIRFIALNDVYSNVVEGGTTPNNMGEEIKTLVTDRMVTGQSLTRPVFSPTIDSGGSIGPAAKFGQTLFTTRLETLRGKGPTICLQQSRFAVEDSYSIAEQNLKDAIKALHSADIRNQLLTKSGVKVVAKAGATSLSQIMTGGYNDVAVDFVGGVPTSGVTHQMLVALSNYMRDNLSPEFFGSGAGQHFVFIASSDMVESIRNQAGIKAETLAFTQGSDGGAKNALAKYAFIEYIYRGLKLGIDQQPLRFNEVDADGFPVLIEPLVETVTDQGVANKANPAWITAKYEVGFLVSKGTFKRLVPERYLGEGSFKFPPQYVMGELEWTNIKDNITNPRGEFGYHLYDITRAFQARRPHGVIPVLYKRCAADLGLSTCSDIASDVMSV
jgi:hypothetical protein